MIGITFFFFALPKISLSAAKEQFTHTRAPTGAA
jgi:hypothetical protein